MGKAFLFIFLCFMLMSIASGIMAGENTYMAVAMTSNVTATSTEIPANTSGFPDSAKIQIDEEVIKYTSIDANSFNGLSRGYENTLAVSHYSGAMVYQEEAGMANSILGFDIAKAASSFTGIVVIPFSFLFTTIPHLISINWNFLSGDWAIIGILWYLLLGAMIVSLAIAFRG